MRIKSLLSFFLYSIFILSSFQLIGQKELITQSGQRIIVAQDGKWQVVPLADTLSDISLNAFDSESIANYPLGTEEQIQANHLMIFLLKQDAEERVKLDRYMNKLQEINLALSSKSVDESSTKDLNQSFKTYQRLVEISSSRSQQIATLVMKTKSLIQGKEEIPNLKLEDYISESEKDLSYTRLVSKVKQKQVNSSIEVVKEKTQSYPRIHIPCQLAYNAFDESLDAKRKETQPVHLLGFSQPKLKQYFKTDDFLTIQSSIAKIKGDHYLVLNVRVKSKDAIQNYGTVKVGDFVNFTVLDAPKIVLPCVQSDSGTVEAYSGHTTYRWIFDLEKDDYNALKKKYLDSMGIMWTTGYEQYPIYNITVIQKQIQCLEKS